MRFKELGERVREIQLEEKKCEHDFEIKQLKQEVEEGIRKRKSLEEEVKREQEYQEQLEEEARLGYDEMSRKRDEMSRKRDEMRKERDEEREGKWKKNFRDNGTQNQREGTTKRAKGKKDNGE